MNQRQRILHALEKAPVCGTTLLGWMIPRYAARIAELRETETIETRACNLHDHKTRQVMYVLHRQSQQDVDWCVCGESLGAINYVGEDAFRVEHHGIEV